MRSAVRQVVEALELESKYNRGMNWPGVWQRPAGRVNKNMDGPEGGMPAMGDNLEGAGGEASFRGRLRLCI
jgi:hypothetical protein